MDMEKNRATSRINESMISAEFEFVEFMLEQEKEEIKFVDPYDWHWLRIITVGVYFVELIASGELSLLYLVLEFSSVLRKKKWNLEKSYCMYHFISSRYYDCICCF